MNYQKINNSFNKVTQSVADLVARASAHATIFAGGNRVFAEEQNLLLLQIFGQVYL